MTKKETLLKQFFNYGLFLMARIFFILARFLPYKLIVPMGRGFGVLAFFLFFGKHKKIAYKNMDIIFNGSLSWLQKRVLMFKSFKEVGSNIFAVCNAERVKERIDDWFEIEGYEHIQTLLDKKFGFITVSIHMGLFMLAFSKLQALRMDVYYTIRSPRNDHMAKLFFNYMARIGVKFILDKPKYQCVMNNLKAIRQGSIPIILTDVKHNPEDGIWTEFLGWRVLSFAGAALLAKRVKRPIVPFVIIKKNNKFVIKFFKAIDVTQESDAEKITQKYTNVLERFVIEYPEQWWWFHDRFRGKKPIENLEAESGRKHVFK